MAVRTEIWVKAHLRRCFAAGLAGVVARRGSEEAGAVFVKVTRAADAVLLFGPAPGPAYDDRGSRRWTMPLGPDPVSAQSADAFLARQSAFDPDIWVLDIDDQRGHGLIEIGREGPAEA
jgi:hypothetical protein